MTESGRPGRRQITESASAGPGRSCGIASPSRPGRATGIRKALVSGRSVGIRYCALRIESTIPPMRRISHCGEAVESESAVTPRWDSMRGIGGAAGDGASLAPCTVRQSPSTAATGRIRMTTPGDGRRWVPGRSLWSDRGPLTTLSVNLQARSPRRMRFGRRRRGSKSILHTVVTRRLRIVCGLAFPGRGYGVPRQPMTAAP